MEKETSAYERYLKGDDEALVKIVEEYKDGLILFINGFVHNIHIAEELCEETFFASSSKSRVSFGAVLLNHGFMPLRAI